MERLSQIPPKTSKSLSILAAGAPNGELIFTLREFVQQNN